MLQVQIKNHNCDKSYKYFKVRTQKKIRYKGSRPDVYGKGCNVFQKTFRRLLLHFCNIFHASLTNCIFVNSFNLFNH